MRLLLALLLCLALPAPAAPGPVRVAVAANFAAPMEVLAARFTRATGHPTRISTGSTGKLYAQIRHGAPFDIFLAADRERPRRLAEAGLGGTPRTYAIGRLILWSRDSGRVQGPAALTAPDVQRIAIANPKTAPYGAAALAILRALDLEAALHPRLVMGENIAQVYQFAATGNAQLGFVAAAQVAAHRRGSRWVPPAHLYPPIRQDALLLERGTREPAARAFWEFLFSPEACRVLKGFAYDCPSDG